MILVFGGAYQGKTDFVRRQFNIEDEQIFRCDENTETLTLDDTKKVWNGFHLFLLACQKKGVVPSAYVREEMKKNPSQWRDKIIVCDDVSCGIVPIDETLRLWREEVGRTLALLSQSTECEEVYRLFCGLERRLK